MLPWSASAPADRPTSAPCATPQPSVDGLTVEVGHVDGLVERDGGVVGVVVGRRCGRSDLVIDAGGRVSRLSSSGGAELGGDTGMAYVTRTYRRRLGAGLGPMAGPVAWTGTFDGYQVYVFPHERSHFSVVFIRPTADADLTVLRHSRHSMPPAGPYPVWPSGPTRSSPIPPVG